MSHKLDFFKHKEYAEEIHLYLMGLPNVIMHDSGKEKIIKPRKNTIDNTKRIFKY